jgi:hypothetical protein
MQHVEKHFSGGDTVRDVVIGMADGLTVPFALAAGISGAIASTHIVVTAGLAEVADQYVARRVVMSGNSVYRRNEVPFGASSAKTMLQTICRSFFAGVRQ